MQEEVTEYQKIVNKGYLLFLERAQSEYEKLFEDALVIEDFEHVTQEDVYSWLWEAM